MRATARPRPTGCAEAIDPWWCPSWPITWQRTYATARAWWLTADGTVDRPDLPEQTVFDGEPLGRWVKVQHAGWAELDQEQQELLLALGIEQDQDLAMAKAVRKKRAAGRPRVSQTDRFHQGVTALLQFAARQGHTRVPRTHKEALVTAAAGAEDTSTLVGLGAWLNSTKSRRAGLSAEQRAALAAAGVEWA